MQKPGGPHARRAAAKRSYPTSEVRGSGREYQTATAQEWPRGATLRTRSGGAAERSYPVSEVRGGGREEIPLAPSPRPGAAGGRSYPMRLRLRPGAVGWRSYTMPLSLRPVAAGRRRYPSPHARGQGQWPGGPTPRPRSRGCLGS